jgi:hypothetical protein
LPVPAMNARLFDGNEDEIGKVHEGTREAVDS